VRGEIVDQGAHGVPRILRAEDDPSNLGLKVVETLTSRWGVHAGSTHVWFEVQPGG
jgi:hypothetical protein